MVALDKTSGELIWSCQRPGDRGAGHASIVISNVAGKKVYVTTTGTGAMGVDPQTENFSGITKSCGRLQ